MICSFESTVMVQDDAQGVMTNRPTRAIRAHRTPKVALQPRTAALIVAAPKTMAMSVSIVSSPMVRRRSLRMWRPADGQGPTKCARLAGPAGSKHRRSQQRGSYLVGVSGGGRIARVEEAATIDVRQEPGPGASLWRGRVFPAQARVFNHAP
jgi:hypothetical protein